MFLIIRKTLENLASQRPYFDTNPKTSARKNSRKIEERKKKIWRAREKGEKQRQKEERERESLNKI